MRSRTGGEKERLPLLVIAPGLVPEESSPPLSTHLVWVVLIKSQGRAYDPRQPNQRAQLTSVLAQRWLGHPSLASQSMAAKLKISMEIGGKENEGRRKMMHQK